MGPRQLFCVFTDQINTNLLEISSSLQNRRFCSSPNGIRSRKDVPVRLTRQIARNIRHGESLRATFESSA